MKIGVLTSSRADFGIYQPLLDNIVKDLFFDLTIIAFGMHCSPLYGSTIKDVESKYDCKIDSISCLLGSDDTSSIVSSYGITVMKFAEYWDANKFDLVLCLGDRYEMSAAVQAGLLFNIKFAHIHGGETTLGAVDNIFRHQITLASSYHFVATEKFAQKVVELSGGSQNIFCVGSISLDGIENFELTSEAELRRMYNFPFGEYILVTFHPETVNEFGENNQLTLLIEALRHVLNQFNIVITMPNADAESSKIREAINEFKKSNSEKVVLVESFGKKNYFSAMKYSKFLAGNTSSGIIEAASFGKYVVNIGDRQKGREQSENIINVEYSNILLGIEKANSLGVYYGKNIYQKRNAVGEIVQKLKYIHEAF